MNNILTLETWNGGTEDGEEIVADAGNNAYLYAANQGSTDLINEAYTEEDPLRFKSQDVIHQRPLSLA